MTEIPIIVAHKGAAWGGPFIGENGENFQVPDPLHHKEQKGVGKEQKRTRKGVARPPPDPPQGLNSVHIAPNLPE